MITEDVVSEIIRVWRPGLEELRNKNRGDERVYPGLLAFCGLQLSMWPLWLRCCRGQGLELPSALEDFDLDDPGLHQLPWFVVVQPVASQAAWVLVRGPGLLESSSAFSVLTHRDVNQCLSYLDESGKSIYFGDARGLLSRLGAYRGADTPLDLPLIHCDSLMDEWRLWWHSLVPLGALLEELVTERVSAGSSGPEMKDLFLHLAAEIWEQLKLMGVIQTGTIPKASLLTLLRLNSAAKSFNGIMLLHGDHQVLWDSIQKEMKE